MKNNNFATTRSHANTVASDILDRLRLDPIAVLSDVGLDVVVPQNHICAVNLYDSTQGSNQGRPIWARYIRAVNASDVAALLTAESSGSFTRNGNVAAVRHELKEGEVKGQTVTEAVVL